ncbi:hypothetical protein D0Z07_6404 [Hyphodiscus hymeniophilus]|uniref:DUF7729 domain-containing protein n=1 Tax=Hyphodiscus hymeniophilus TaxID=353542 RepID=A0A9P6VFF7_9HELO|nr:hypothetical protein D0Z07_6404 [Hyphodiscus hymeniophilus]
MDEEANKTGKRMHTTITTITTARQASPFSPLSPLSPKIRKGPAPSLSLPWSPGSLPFHECNAATRACISPLHYRSHPDRIRSEEKDDWKGSGSSTAARTHHHHQENPLNTQLHKGTGRILQGRGSSSRAPLFGRPSSIYIGHSRRLLALDFDHSSDAGIKFIKDSKKMDTLWNPENLSMAMDEVRDDGVSRSSSRRILPHSPSHHHSTTPTDSAPRNGRLPWLRLLPTPSFCLIVILTISCCISLSSASRLYIDEQMIEGFENEVSEDLGSALARLAKSGTIVVDQREPPPNPKAWTLATEHDGLQRRGLEASSSSDHASSVTSSSATSMITTTSGSRAATKTLSTSTGIAAATTDAATPLPSPFDQGFNGNITDSCQSFMSGMLTNSTFKSCLPFSLLLQNSNSFFQSSKSLVRISQTLDATCAADLNTCAPLMSVFASNITTATACASDLASGNPLIEQARLGLLAYKPLYTASCLRNPSTSSYCFADAVTNASSPTDSYIYYLPLNISLPGGSQPTCDACLKNTMAVFEAASSDRSSALTSDYVSAAMQVNVQCGPNFVNQSLAAAVVSGGRMESVSPGVGILALAMLIGSWLM